MPDTSLRPFMNKFNTWFYTKLLSKQLGTILNTF